MIVLDSVTSIFDVGAEALVNPVNCVGVAGKGLALEFKNRFPSNFKVYSETCLRRQLEPGGMLTVRNNLSVCPRYIFNFSTKNHWRDGSRLEWIDSGLIKLVAIVEEENIRSIAIPALGCGLGGLRWDHVNSAIRNAFQRVSDEVIVTLLPPRDRTVVASNI